MEKIQYLDIIKRAFVITWKNKFLWIFGFLLFIGILPLELGAKRDLIVPVNSVAATYLKTYWEKYPATSVFIAIVLILLAFILLLLRLISIAAIIKSANNIAVYKQSSILKIFFETKKYLGKLFILDFILISIFAIISSILFIPIVYLFSLGAYISFGISSVIAGVMIICLIVLVYFLRKYSQIYLVLSEMRLKIAIESAYDLFERKAKESLLFGIIAIGLRIGMALVSIAILIMVGIVITPLALLCYIMFAKAGIVIASALGLIIAIIAMMLAYSWFELFIQALWVQFFQEITLQKKKDKEHVEEVEIQGSVPTPEAV